MNIHLDLRRRHVSDMDLTVLLHIFGDEAVLMLNLSSCAFCHVVGCEIGQDQLARAMGMEIT